MHSYLGLCEGKSGKTYPDPPVNNLVDRDLGITREIGGRDRISLALIS